MLTFDRHFGNSTFSDYFGPHLKIYSVTLYRDRIYTQPSGQYNIINHTGIHKLMEHYIMYDTK